MAISDVAIANLALSLLGASRRIESLLQDHPNARTMAAWYEPVRDATLRAHPWSFAIQRARLAADSIDTLFGDLNRFLVPTDFLRILPPTDTTLDLQIESRYITTTWSAPLDIRYLARITDTSLFDPLFVQAFACQLAISTCEEITQSNTKKTSVREDLKFWLAEARRTNAIERVSETPLDDPWITAQA